MANVVIGLLRNKFKRLPAVENVSLAGKTVIVTGGNDGIGFEVAKQLVAFGPKKLILASRNIAKTENAIQAIRGSIGETSVSMEAWSLDLADFESVKRFAEMVTQKLNQVDILILNAGAIRPRFVLSKDGYEEVVQIDCLSQALLSFLLLPLLRKTAAISEDSIPRIVVTSSRGYRFIQSFNDYSPELVAGLNDPKNYSSSDRYFRSKLMSILFFGELGKRLQVSQTFEDARIAVSSVCPGSVRTNLANNSPGGWLGVFAARVFMFLFSREPGYAARTIVHAAVSSEGREYRGDFLLDFDVQKEMHGAVIDTPEGNALQANLWEETCRIYHRVSGTCAPLFA